MNILITGGAGFQGSHLTDSLVEQGHNVSILNTYSEKAERNLKDSIKNIKIIWGSITDKEIIDKTVRGNDVVFHLAAHVNVDESLKNPYVFYDVNVLGTMHVLEAVKKYGARLIFVSTCEVYGDGHEIKYGAALNEHAELRPNSPYAASKAAADRMCHAFSTSYDINMTIIRPFNVYGERQKSNTFGALIPILTAKALRGEFLTVFGDGSATRDYSHISDIIQSYNLVLQNPDKLKNKVINFANGQEISVKEIAQYIAKKLNVEVVHGPARPGEVSRFPADISFAKSLGYSPKVNIWEGLDRYINWAKQQKD